MLRTLYNQPCSYQVGGSLQPNSQVYVTRKADEELYKYLSQGHFCYVLSSRQVGKSSLRVRTMDRLTREGIKCVSLDLSLVVSHDITLEQWYASITYLLVSELKLYEYINIRQWWRSHNELSVQLRLKFFFEQVVLENIRRKIIVFLDEIDSIKSLKFSINDFFQIIGNFHEERVNNPDLNRLNFAVFGVGTPEQLMQTRDCNPFINGRSIELSGFKLHEVNPLVDNLPTPIKGKSEILKRVLKWTSGQPFLTQKICYLIYNLQEELQITKTLSWLDKLVREFIIFNWQEKDNPEHLKTVSDRILYNPISPANLLRIYQNIRQQGQIPYTDTLEEKELILSGLIIKGRGKLKIKNLIYQQIFDDVWIDRHLRKFQA